MFMRNFYHFLIILLILLNYTKAFSNKLINLEKRYEPFSLPQILSNSDKKTYLEVNELQMNGKWQEADKKILTLENKILIGYLEYDKLMHPNKYKSSYSELLAWLQTYDDFPVVMQRRVYNLLIKRASANTISHKFNRPQYGNYLRGYGENKKHYNNEKILKAKYKKFKLTNEIVNLIKEQRLSDLKKYYNINENYKLSIMYQLQKDAKKKFNKGLLNEALLTYKFLISEMGIENPFLYFKAGLISFRLKNIKESKKFFENCNSVIQISKLNYSPHLVSVCLYWEARLTDIKNRRIELFTKASKFERTIYGQLAIEKLNKKENFIWKGSNIEYLDKYSESISKLNIFKRLIALSELNFYNKADLEMRNLYSKLEKEKRNVAFLFHLSEKLDLAAVQIRLGETFLNKNPVLYMRGMYPTPSWGLEEGFIFDRAFIYAIIRRESAFNFRAKSSKGARGLMQLMPRTASKIKKDYKLRYGNKHQLYSLNLNLELGQKLLKQLVNDPNTKKSILNTLIAYNAGITRLKKWNATIKESDPLAFIESIPIKETRMFVKFILADLWIYRDKLGQNKPTRSMLADNKWPILPTQDYYYSKDAKLR